MELMQTEYRKLYIVETCFPRTGANLLIFFKGLFWEFSAETISIVLVQVIVGVYSFKEHQYMRDGWVILVLYPASIFFVFVLEKVAGLN